MKKTIQILLASILLASCGNKEQSVDTLIESGDLAALKAKKVELQQQQQRLKSKITKLENKIQQLDTTQTGTVAFVEVETLKPQTFKHYITAQGSISSEENIMVSPEIPGVITKVHVKEGDKVKPGQLLATMDASALQSQLQQVETSYNLAETTYQRRKNLWEQNIGSEMQLLQSKSQMESLKSQMDAIKAQIAKARMVSPVSGTVDAVNLKLGEMANPGMNGIRVVNMSELKAEARIADSYAGNIQEGDEVKIFLPDLNDTIYDKISFVSQAIDPKSRSITVETNLENKNRRLKPNMIAKLEINNYTADSTTVVSSNVLLSDPNSPNGYYIMGVEKENNAFVAKRYDVKIGKQYGGKTEILSGLPENATIITFGFGNVAEGQSLVFSEKQ